MIFYHFYEEKQLLFVTSCLLFWAILPFQNREYFSRKELTPNEIGGKIKIKRVASPESVPVRLDVLGMIICFRKSEESVEKILSICH